MVLEIAPYPGHIEELRLIGGRLCLDFANTFSSRHALFRRDYLIGYDDLLDWGRYTGAIDLALAGQLSDEAARWPEVAAATIQRARALREAIYHVFTATSRGASPSPPDLDILNTALATAQSRLRLRPEPDGWTWTWLDDDPPALDRVLWPVMRSAADLLTSPDIGRVRACPGEAGGCGWLFLDTSKGNQRRWCQMRDCGNRAKVRRYYARFRATPATTPGQ